LKVNPFHSTNNCFLGSSDRISHYPGENGGEGVHHAMA